MDVPFNRFHDEVGLGVDHRLIVISPLRADLCGVGPAQQRVGVKHEIVGMRHGIAAGIAQEHENAALDLDVLRRARSWLVKPSRSP